MVDSFYSSASLSASRKCRNKLDRVAKGFALSIVHEGTNDCISEAAITRMYEISYRGISNYFEVEREICHSLAPNCTEIATVT